MRSHYGCYMCVCVFVCVGYIADESHTQAYTMDNQARKLPHIHAAFTADICASVMLFTGQSAADTEESVVIPVLCVVGVVVVATVCGMALALYYKQKRKLGWRVLDDIITDK